MCAVIIEEKERKPVAGTIPSWEKEDCWQIQVAGWQTFESFQRSQQAAARGLWACHQGSTASARNVPSAGMALILTTTIFL